ncbi:SpoVR family protein [Shigella flexneri]
MGITLSSKTITLFRSWTDASSIVDYLIFARKYITECEERYGVDKVETALESCHALMNYGVDRYKRRKKSRCREKARQKSREEYLQSQVNMLWRTLPKREEEKTVAEARRYPSEPQETCSYFIENKCATAGIMRNVNSCVLCVR